MILLTDLHIKRNKLNIDWWDKTHKPFLDELVSTIKNEIIVCIGDLFDKEVNPADIFDEVRYRFEQLVANGNVIHIIRGNHDFSTLEGCSLSILKRIPNIHIYREVSIVETNGKKCLMIPHYSQSMKNSKDITNFKDYILQQCEGIDIDYIFSHNTLPELAIKEEGLSVRKELNAMEFTGHIHHFSEGENWLNLGTPYQTRADEEGKESYIYRLVGKDIIKINLETDFLKFKTIDFNLFEKEAEFSLPTFDKTTIYTINILCDNESLIQAKLLEKEIDELGIYTRKLKITNKDDVLALEEYSSETNGKSDKDLFTLIAKKNKTENSIYKLGLELIDELN